MLDAFKIRWHRFKIDAKKRILGDPKPAFVNPYARIGPAPAEPSIQKVKLNPYITDYGSKPKKTFVEFLKELTSKKEPEPILPWARHDTVVASEEPLPEVEPTGPTFLDDVRVILGEDLLFVATRLPKWNRQERRMSADEIAAACKNIQW